jgi:hypothetical protein
MHMLARVADSIRGRQLHSLHGDTRKAKCRAFRSGEPRHTTPRAVGDVVISRGRLLFWGQAKRLYTCTRMLITSAINWQKLFNCTHD